MEISSDSGDEKERDPAGRVAGKRNRTGEAMKQGGREGDFECDPHHG